MKKIISIILLCFSFHTLFSQGKLTDDYNYLISINKQITDIVKISISKEKLRAIIKKEQNTNMAYLFIEIYQDSTGCISKVLTKQRFYDKFFTKRELRKIKRQIKKIGKLDIYVDWDVLHYLTKENYFSIAKYSQTFFVIKLDTVSD